VSDHPGKKINRLNDGFHEQRRVGLLTSVKDFKIKYLFGKYRDKKLEDVDACESILRSVACRRESRVCRGKSTDLTYNT